MHMTPIAILAIIFAVVQAATITLPVTQDFAIVNQDRVRSVIAKNDKISLFNNGILSSISYFGVDTQPIIRQAEITSTSPVRSMIESAQLIFNNITLLSAQVGAINIHVSALNPGQVWTEDTVTLETTPTIQGSLGSIDFSKEKPTLDVTNHVIQALSDPYQGAMFGFHIGMPGGPLEVASHRANPNSVVVEIIYSPAVGPGATSPIQSTTTTNAPAPTNPTTAPGTYCWSCGPGWTHWFNVQGVAQPEDPCACVRDPAASTAVPGVPTTSTTRAPSAGTTTTRAPAAGTTTTTSAPGAPTTSGAPGSSSTTAEFTTTTGPAGTERQNSAAKSAFSALVVFVLLALYL